MVNSSNVRRKVLNYPLRYNFFTTIYILSDIDPKVKVLAIKEYQTLLKSVVSIMSLFVLVLFLCKLLIYKYCSIWSS